MFASIALLALSYPPQAPTRMPMPPQFPVAFVVMPPQAPDATELVKVKSCPCSDQCTCGCNEGRPCQCESRVVPYRTQPVAQPVTLPVTLHAPVLNYTQAQPSFQQNFGPVGVQFQPQPLSLQQSFVPSTQQMGSFRAQPSRGASASC